MLLRLGAAVKLNKENRATSIQKAIISEIFLKQKLNDHRGSLFAPINPKGNQLW